MGCFNREVLTAIAKVIVTVRKKRGHGINFQSVRSAALVRRRARSQVNQVMADWGQIRVGVPSLMRYLILHVRSGKSAPGRSIALLFHRRFEIDLR
jgi:hypothetical protein